MQDDLGRTGSAGKEDQPCIGIVGLGTLGDVHHPARDGACDRMAQAPQTRTTARKLTEADRDATLSRLTIANGLTALRLPHSSSRSSQRRLKPSVPFDRVAGCARPYHGETLALLSDGRKSAEIDAALGDTGRKLGP